MVYLGADHGGFKYKEKMREYLLERGYQVTDLGAATEEPGDDYPLIAERVALKVKEDPNNRGVLICRSGAGVSIVANKIKGVRAAQAWTDKLAKEARNDVNINVLCLAADYHEFDEIKKMVQAFLDTSFGTEERYRRRLKQLQEIEGKY